MPQIAIFWSKNDVERMLKYAKTAAVMKNLIPYSQRRENFLSISIQHIYSLNHQKAMPTFIKHAKCKNSPKKIDETAIKMDICGKMAIKRSNEGVFRPTRARHAIQKINFAWPYLCDTLDTLTLTLICNF